MKIYRVMSFFILFVFAISCGPKESLEELERFAQIDKDKSADVVTNLPLINVAADFCTLNADTIKSNLKFIFVMDKSGSNQDQADGTNGTDAQGTRRYGPLLTFLNNSPSDSTIFFSLVNFSTNSSTQIINWYYNALGQKVYYTSSMGETSFFTNAKGDFQKTVQYESNPDNSDPAQPVDAGWTDFMSALGQVNGIIQNDIKAAKLKPEIVSSYYVVFFISDGAPRIRERRIGYPVEDGLQDKADILTAVKSIVQLEEENKAYVDSIQIHTGYYFSEVPDPLADPDNYKMHLLAQDYMQEMSEIGNGMSYQFGNGQNIDFKKFTLPARNVKHQLRDVIINNINTIWLNDELVQDSDGDGLADILEQKLGSKIDQYDSDGNGISDGTEFYMSEQPCKDSLCRNNLADPYTACQGYVAEVRDGVKIYSDRDKDRLNDCEEQVILKSKMDNFDSNADWVPDELAFRTGLSFLEGSNEANLDTDRDGIQNYLETKLNTPLNFPNSSIANLKPYNYTLEVTNNTSMNSCYHLEVNDVVSYSPDDIIRMYVIENTTVIDDKRFIRIVDKPRNGESTVKFREGDFKK